MEQPAALRARFGWPPERPCATVGGEPCLGSRLSCTAQTFGDFRWAQGIPRAEYRVELPLPYVEWVLEPERLEWMEDARLYPTPEDDFEQAMIERGWPVLRDVLAHPVLLPLTMELYAHELLVHWLGAGQPAELPGWVAHSITHHARVGEALVIGGTALMAGR